MPPRTPWPPCRGLVRGSLAVGSLLCLPSVHLPAVLARVAAAYPGLDISLRQGGSHELTDQVRTGRLHIAFVSRPARSPEALIVQPLTSEPLVVACYSDHPFAARTHVEAAELRDERFVDFQQDWGYPRPGRRVLADAGIDRRVALEVTDVHSLLDLVTFGLGIAIVPQSFAAKTDRARFIPLAGTLLAWETVTITNDPTGPAATALLEAINNSHAQPAPDAAVKQLAEVRAV